MRDFCVIFGQPTLIYSEARGGERSVNEYYSAPHSLRTD
jgi:hypothetical protein